MLFIVLAKSVCSPIIPLLSLDGIPRTRLDLVRARRPRPVDLHAALVAFDLHRAGPSPFVDVRTRVRARALAVSTGDVGSLLALRSHHAHAGWGRAQALVRLLRGPGEMVVLLQHLVLKGGRHVVEGMWGCGDGVGVLT